MIARCRRRARAKHGIPVQYREPSGRTGDQGHRYGLAGHARACFDGNIVKPRICLGLCNFSHMVLCGATQSHNMRTPIRVGQTGTQSSTAVFTAHPPAFLHADRDRAGRRRLISWARTDHRDLPIKPLPERGDPWRVRAGRAVLLQSGLPADEFGALDRTVRTRNKAGILIPRHHRCWRRLPRCCVRAARARRCPPAPAGRSSIPWRSASTKTAKSRAISAMS